ncbi:MAG: MAPEG family protein [Burkholderiaceae bacterium]|uniref:MAPEG family protein n=1 Tax=Herminiimonas contaminans TaxID=1111140 RepID=A0ABS0EWV6_9BURK|nr:MULTISPECIES: MAPEG family protein [Oxalobacteraceae]MBF8179332.1 MAPEG family protein [Herminiimonas contaminans]MBX9798886.1 MAPEG family protein [Burkholderiaceae bacterium]
MNLSYWCILIAGILPVATVAIAKWGKRDFDNSEPRRWLEKQEGLRRRADSAHRNHFEAFPFFAAGVLVAQQLNADQDSINMLAVAFIAARLVYTLLYLTDRATLRSITWLIGYLAVVGLFLLPAFDGG